MAFVKKTWKNRIAEYINRRLLTNEDGSTNLVTVARDEGTISQEGDAFNAANMNDLEDRIEAEFEEINQSLTQQKIQYKDISFKQVKINRKSGEGLYYSDNMPLGIDHSFVISLIIIGWGGASRLFNIYYDYASNGISFMCDASITITSVSIRVCYIQ